MSDASALLGKQIELQLIGHNLFTGVLTDLSSDMLVLFTEQRFFYFPILHVRRFNLSTDSQKNSDISPPIGFYIAEEKTDMSYRKVLMYAKGIFSEIYVTGKISLHGYIMNVFNDYFTFYSPVYKLMYISLHHLKWLTPYTQGERPYSLTHEQFPINPTSLPLYRSLEEQLKTIEGKLVVFDGGEDPKRMGLLKKSENSMVELVTAKGERIYLNLTQIQTVHVP
ncbi:DUF2642 domain-containing protein [Peribacillus sp. NPDC097264]|uniref:DUF2642 domain-containing protein n=1 Tax=Peribacillus sp. NPDC097264 TaxID=3390616 RepID=UPI003CFE461D